MSTRFFLATVLALCLVSLHGCTSSRRNTRNAGQVNGQFISLLGRTLEPVAEGPQRVQLTAQLRSAQRDLQDHPGSAELLVWVGRRWGYLWEIGKAIEVFSDGIAMHPDYAPLYRHRGHRYISSRQFQRAIADLERAASLIEGKVDQVEPDGAPNDRNIPLTTTGFNVWYHLALAKYLSQDFEGAVDGFRRAQKLGRGFDDNLVATTDWIYMALRRLGREEEAAQVLAPIHKNMEIIENLAYHRRVMLYKGLITPEELLDLEKASDLDLATMGYGLGNWYLYNSDSQRAQEIFERVVAGPYWPAFGFIAAEVDLARLRKR